ncbi:MAG: hypothetical protein NTU79_01165 [Planctomycetota bacterium]|jgi:hypothetical protein|nr:hypothetical protein [Planctomycetota bacterium]
MPITIDETYRSREGTEGDQPSAELRFVIQGTDDDSIVRSLLLAYSPRDYLGLRRTGVTFEPLGGEIWEGTAQYSKQEAQFTFDTGGGTQHISQSRGTVGIYAAPGEIAPNFGGAIGVNDDQVGGTDITVPVYNFTETHYIDDLLVTEAYKLKLFNLTGKVNDGLFKGFAKGELLFLGASGSKRGKDDWEITFRFAASPNVAGLSLGAINGIAKEGWHYLWVRFTDDEDQGSHTLIKKPISAYVEQVYPYGDFSLLGLAG